MRSTALEYLTADRHWPQWNHKATGRPRQYISKNNLQALTVFNFVHAASSGAQDTLLSPEPHTWSGFTTSLIMSMDLALKRKQTWQQRSRAAVLVATLDLLMSVCLDLALHVQHVKTLGILVERAEVFDQLVSLCVFCAEKILSFRETVLPRLGVTQPGFFEESALHLLHSIGPEDAQTERLASHLEAACWASFLWQARKTDRAQ